MKDTLVSKMNDINNKLGSACYPFLIVVIRHYSVQLS